MTSGVSSCRCPHSRVQVKKAAHCFVHTGGLADGPLAFLLEAAVSALTGVLKRRRQPFRFYQGEHKSLTTDIVLINSYQPISFLQMQQSSELCESGRPGFLVPKASSELGELLVRRTYFGQFDEL